MVTGEVTGGTVTPILWLKNKVMILNGPAFFGWHRPIVLQGFLAHTPPSVSNARKMFNWADHFFLPHFFSALAQCHECSWEQRSLAATQTPLQKLKSIGLFSIVKKNSQLTGTNNKSIRRHTSSVLMHSKLKVPFKVAGLPFTRDLGGLCSFKGVCKPGPCFCKGGGNWT